MILLLIFCVSSILANCPEYVPTSLSFDIDQYQLDRDTTETVSSGHQVFSSGVTSRLHSIDLDIVSGSGSFTLNLYSGSLVDPLNLIATSQDTEPETQTTSVVYTAFIFPTLPPITSGQSYTFAFNASPNSFEFGGAPSDKYINGASSFPSGDFRFRTNYTPFRDANLKCLQTTQGTISPPFPSTTTTYTITLPANRNTTTLTYGVSLGTRVTEVDGVTRTAWAPLALDFSTQSSLQIKTASLDALGSPVVYDFTLQRQTRSSKAALSSLAVVSSEPVQWDNVFEEKRYVYHVDLKPCSARYTDANFECQITFNGGAAEGGMVVATVQLGASFVLGAADIGVTKTVQLMVTSADGSRTQNYTVTYTLNPGVQSLLRGISVAPQNGQLLQPFSPSEMNYVANFFSDQTTGVVNISYPLGAVVRHNGVVVNGNQIQIPLSGVTACQFYSSVITVTSEDGMSISTYDLNYTRLDTGTIPSAIQTQLSLDVADINFPANFTEFSLVLDDLSRVLGAEIQQIVILETQITTTQARVTVGFKIPTCGEIDYQKHYIVDFDSEMKKPQRGDFVDTSLALATTYTTSLSRSVSVCTIGGQVSWGTVCTELGTPGDTSPSSGSLTYEEAVGIVVGISIICVIILFLFDFFWRKANKRERKAQSKAKRPSSPTGELTSSHNGGASSAREQEGVEIA